MGDYLKKKTIHKKVKGESRHQKIPYVKCQKTTRSLSAIGVHFFFKVNTNFKIASANLKIKANNILLRGAKIDTYLEILIKSESETLLTRNRHLKR